MKVLIGDLLYTLEVELGIAIEKHKEILLLMEQDPSQSEQGKNNWKRLLNYKEFIMNRLMNRDNTLTLPEYMKALNHMNEVYEDTPKANYFEIDLKWNLNDKAFKRGRKLNDII